MRRKFLVTTITEIDFVGNPSEDVIQSHLNSLVDRAREAAESLSTRVTAAVHVTFCAGGAITSTGKASGEQSQG